MLIIPTLHPVLLVMQGRDDDSQGKYEQTVLADLTKGQRLTRSLPTWDERLIHEKDPSGRPWRVFPTAAEVCWFFDRFYAACKRHPQAVIDGSLSLTVDVETTKDSPLLSLLICTGFGFLAPDEEQVINVPTLSCGGTRYWSEPDEAYVRGMCKYVLADPTVPKVMHNKGFDCAVLFAQGMPVKGWVWDTMAAHHVWDGEMPHNLGFVGSLLTDGRFWKDDAKGDGGFLLVADITLRTYNLRDLLVTQRCQHQLHAKLKHLNLWALYLKQLRGIDIMTRASVRGMLIDEDRRTSTAIDAKTGKFIGLKPQLEKQRDDALVMLRQVAGSAAFDPGKPAHVSHLFFQQLGFPVVLTSEKTGKPKVDKEAMMLLELVATTRDQKVALRGVIEYRQAEKLLGTFITGLGKFVHPQTWRFHTQWKLLAVTGRWTSSPNAQNWGRRIKRMFRAAQGWKFVGVDLSQAELRYIAYLAADRDLLDMYAQGINVHTVNTALLFKIKCAEPKDTNPATEAFISGACKRLIGADYSTFPTPDKYQWKAIRTLAKGFAFGINYGAEAETVYRILRSKRDPDTNKLLFPHLLLSEVQALRIMWIKRLHPDIAIWWEDIQNAIRARGGYFCPISGRVRWFRGGFKRTEMLNVPIQMGVASWMNDALVEIQDTFDRETGGLAQVVQQVHDALNVESPEWYAKRCGEVMCEVLNRPFKLLGFPAATLPADAALIGDYLDEV
jgi:DNA polymerase I-like protein with 3'-5' exonuclease and polymerase domains